MFHLYLFSSLFAVIRTSFEYSWLSQDYKKLKTQRGTMWWTIFFEVFGLVKKMRLEVMLSSTRILAVFVLDYALSVWTNLGKHSLFVWLFVSSVKTGTRHIILLDELSSVERVEGRPFWSLAFWVISTFCKFAHSFKTHSQTTLFSKFPGEACPSGAHLVCLSSLDRNFPRKTWPTGTI